MQRKSEEINEARAKIGDVLIQAQEKAEKMLEEARLEVADEKERLEKTLENEREKLVDIRADIKNLKAEIVKVLSKYETELSELAKEEEKSAEAAEDMAEGEAAASYELDPGAGDETGYSQNSYDPGFTRY